MTPPSRESASDEPLVPPSPEPEPPPDSRLRLRHSLAARISALMLLVLLAAGGSAAVALGQLRALQRGFDRLVEVYVLFNRNLAVANVQAVRVGVQVRTWDQSQDKLEPGFERNFKAALTTRNANIADARAPIDEALADPGRVEGGAALEDLRQIQASLDQLETLAVLDEMVDAREVLQDVSLQGRIEQQFKTLADQSRLAIDALRAEVQQAQVRTERLTLAFTLIVSALGMLAAIGVFLTLRPLRRLTEGVRKLSRGDWSQRVSPSRPDREDEVSQLAREFNHMAAALEERERRLLRGERLAAAGQLAAQITHEIRNPLSSVALNAELLEDELSEGSPEGRELLAKISKEVDRLTAVTEDYLSFARRPKPELTALDLREELHDLLDFMAQELDMAGIDVEPRLPDEPVYVRGDANQLRQVFMNLVRNAQEALLDEDQDPERRPRIEVDMRCKEDQVFVVVRDNGPGIPIPEGEVDRIFEAFYTSKARGTGLGLPTVQQIVQDHQGGVRVAQTGPEGTAFEVQLPACAPEGGSVSSPAATLAVS